MGCLPYCRKSTWMPKTLVIFLLAPLAGCGYSGGEFLFMTGLFKRPTVEAKFKLTDGPVAVIVDDFGELCHWPEALGALERLVVEQLSKHNAGARFISPMKVRTMRQSYPEFDKRGFRELGRLLGADQVVAIGVRAFKASVEVREVKASARMSVALKVIDSRKDLEGGRVRLWPTSRSGEIVVVEFDASMVTRAKTRERIMDKLTTALADKIARKFYDRPMADFENE